MPRTRDDVDINLRCDLADSELLLKGMQLAQANAAAQQAQDQAKAIATEMKKRIEECQGRVKELNADMLSKTEMRMVRCTPKLEFYMGRRQWVTRRLDTGAVVETTSATIDDDQEELFAAEN